MLSLIPLMYPTVIPLTCVKVYTPAIEFMGYLCHVMRISADVCGWPTWLKPWWCNMCHRPLFSIFNFVLCFYLHISPAVLVSCFPHLLQISLPAVLWSSSSSVAMWHPLPSSVRSIVRSLNDFCSEDRSLFLESYGMMSLHTHLLRFFC